MENCFELYYDDSGLYNRIQTSGSCTFYSYFNLDLLKHVVWCYVIGQITNAGVITNSESVYDGSLFFVCKFVEHR
mgnify:CR=1 FL=1